MIIECERFTVKVRRGLIRKNLRVPPVVGGVGFGLPIDEGEDVELEVEDVGR